MNNPRYKPFSKNKMFLILTALLFVMSAVATGLNFYKLRVSQRQLEQIAEEINRYHLLTAQVKEQEEDWKYQQRSINAIEVKIPSTENLPSLIIELDRMADICGVRITSLVVGTVSPVSESGQETDLELNLIGSYDQVKEYLTHLVRTERHLSVKKFQLDRAQQYQTNAISRNKSYPELWHARIEFCAYHWLADHDVFELGLK